MEGWTFGIITSGGCDNNNNNCWEKSSGQQELLTYSDENEVPWLRPSLSHVITRIRKCIEGIKKQNISNYEIIIVGNVDIVDDYVKVIKFDENIKHMWITRKHNLIAQNALFNKILIMHDYFMPDEIWFNEMCNFGDDWDICVCRLQNRDGLRYRDWMRYLSFIDENDLTREDMHFSAVCFCIKKEFILKYPSDENHTWFDACDFEYSRRLNKIWKYRYNPKAIVHIIKHRISDPFCIYEWEEKYRGKTIEELRKLSKEHEWYLSDDQLDETKILCPCNHPSLPVRSCCIGSAHNKITKEQIEEHHRKNIPSILGYGKDWTTDQEKYERYMAKTNNVILWKSNNKFYSEPKIKLIDDAHKILNQYGLIEHFNNIMNMNNKIGKIINSDFGLVIQGPLNPISILSSPIYLQFFKYVVISCWNDDLYINEAQDYLSNYNNIFLITSNKTNIEPYIQNVNYQKYTTYYGLLRLEELGICNVIKCRSDMVLGNVSNLYFLLDYAVNNNKITSSSVFFRKIDVAYFHIGDTIVGGNINELKLMFNPFHEFIPCVCSEMNLTMTYLFHKKEIPKYIDFNTYDINNVEKLMKKYFIPFDVLKLSPLIMKSYNTYCEGFNDFNCMLDENDNWKMEKEAVYIIGQIRSLKQNYEMLKYFCLNNPIADYYISTCDKSQIFVDTGIIPYDINPKKEIELLGINNIKYFNITDEYYDNINKINQKCEDRNVNFRCTSGGIISKFRMKECMKAMKDTNIEYDRITIIRTDISISSPVKKMKEYHNKGILMINDIFFTGKPEYMNVLCEVCDNMCDYGNDCSPEGQVSEWLKIKDVPYTYINCNLSPCWFIRSDKIFQLAPLWLWNKYHLNENKLYLRETLRSIPYIYKNTIPELWKQEKLLEEPIIIYDMTKKDIKINKTSNSLIFIVSSTYMIKQLKEQYPHCHTIGIINPSPMPYDNLECCKYLYGNKNIEFIYL